MAIKEREYLMSVSPLKRPVVQKNKEAIAMLLTRLILLDPGSDPLHPEMGVGIRNYRYAMGKLEELKSRVADQIAAYLPDFQSVNVDIAITDNHMCNIEITINDTIYTYNSAEAPIPITLDSLSSEI